MLCSFAAWLLQLLACWLANPFPELTPNELLTPREAPEKELVTEQKSRLMI